MNNNIAIIGAGVGGLASAARLAKQGFNVNVYEKLSGCGGRNNIIIDNGFKFDTGPSFVMMPDFFKEFFNSCNESISDYINLKNLDAHYKIFYPDNTTLTIYGNQEKTEAELEKIEPGSSKKYALFMQEAGKIYNAVVPLLYRCFTPKDGLNPAYWPLLLKLDIGKTYWQLVKKFFKSEKLCYAFTFEAMFIGVSPFTAPAFYSIISYTDHAHKISHPMGGMYQIPLAFEKIAKKYGTKFIYNFEINSLKNYKNKFILNDNIEADKVIINADYAYSQRQLLKRKLPDFDYSCSVYLMYLGLKKKINGLSHHNLFFANNLQKNLNNIFNTGKISDDFSFYVHVPTVTDHSLAPNGKDILYALIPVPNLKKNNVDFNEYENNVRKVIFNKLSSICEDKIENLIEVEHKFYPKDFKSRYNIEYGATFGLAHTFMQSAFFRPANIDSQMRNLYYVGASTQPGGGLPPVIASSKIVTDLIETQKSPNALARG